MTVLKKYLLIMSVFFSFFTLAMEDRSDPALNKLKEVEKIFCELEERFDGTSEDEVSSQDEITKIDELAVCLINLAKNIRTYDHYKEWIRVSMLIMQSDRFHLNDNTLCDYFNQFAEVYKSILENNIPMKDSLSNLLISNLEVIADYHFCSNHKKHEFEKAVNKFRHYLEPAKQTRKRDLPNANAANTQKGKKKQKKSQVSFTKFRAVVGDALKDNRLQYNKLFYHVIFQKIFSDESITPNKWGMNQDVITVNSKKVSYQFIEDDKLAIITFWASKNEKPKKKILGSEIIRDIYNNGDESNLKYENSRFIRYWIIINREVKEERTTKQIIRDLMVNALMGFNCSNYSSEPSQKIDLFDALKNGKLKYNTLYYHKNLADMLSNKLVTNSKKYFKIKGQTNVKNESINTILGHLSYSSRTEDKLLIASFWAWKNPKDSRLSPGGHEIVRKIYEIRNENRAKDTCPTIRYWIFINTEIAKPSAQEIVNSLVDNVLNPPNVHERSTENSTENSTEDKEYLDESGETTNQPNNLDGNQDVDVNDYFDIYPFLNIVENIDYTPAPVDFYDPHQGVHPNFYVRNPNSYQN